MQYPIPPLFSTSPLKQKKAPPRVLCQGGSLVLHGLCGGLLLCTQHEPLCWLFLLLCWLLVAASQGFLLRTTRSRLQDILAPTLVISLLIFLTEHPQQALFFGAGLLLIGTFFAAGYARIYQDRLLQERSALRTQVALYSAWQTHKQAQIEQELAGRLLLEQHQANNLLCGIVLHVNIASSLLDSGLFEPHPTTPHAPDTTQELQQNILDLTETSRKLQHLFAEQLELTAPEQLRRSSQGRPIDLCDAFARAQHRTQIALPDLSILDLSEYNGSLFLPEDLDLPAFFFDLFCMLSQSQPHPTLHFTTQHFPHAHPPALRIELQGIPDPTLPKRHPHQASASSIELFLSWLHLFLDLRGGRLISPPSPTPSNFPPPHGYRELPSLIFDLPVLSVSHRIPPHKTTGPAR
ncbi:hypothetical protein L6R29_08180 [Myxococcota bacterium]|nr:hypothetical protein [Myxococcota bacterium]